MSAQSQPGCAADAATPTAKPSALHTPGPWSWDSGVVPPDGPGRYSDIYVDSGDKIIASINEFPEYSPEEGKANARLIAAAPDLLEALVNYNDAVATYMLTPSAKRTYHHEQRLKAAAAIARAAISKATGEA